jgi:DNA-binding NarL/FixJ family response regulator
MEKIRVLIVDDNDVLRNGLGVFFDLFEDLELVGEATNGLEAIERCEALKPDVVLMDLVLPKMDGVAATRRIRQSYPQIKVLALTSFEDEKRVEAAIEAGAVGCLLKNLDIDELAQAIRAAHAGQSVLSQEVIDLLSKNQGTST